MESVSFEVGPSKPYPTWDEHAQAVLDKRIGYTGHRTPKFQELYENTTRALRRLLNIPSDHSILFLDSASTGMGITIDSLVENCSRHIIQGAFGRRFYEAAVKRGKEATEDETPFGEIPTLSDYNVDNQTELMCLTHNETSAGTTILLEDMYALAKKYPGILLAVDAASSLPYPIFNYEKIDVTIFSVQKGFGMEPGLGVLIASPRAIEKAQELRESGTSNDLFALYDFHNKGKDNQTPYTPNTRAIYILGKICEDMYKKGIEDIREETREKAQLIYDFFDGHPKYNLFVSNHEARSLTTIVIDVRGNSKEVIENVRKKGFELSPGYGKYKPGHIRIGNFPAHTIEETEKLLEVFK